MANKVVVMMGSKSDENFVDSIGECLGKNGIAYETAIASAHRTPDHLQRLLDIYENSDDHIVYITVAGLSDALTGTVAARKTSPVVACPPDVHLYGESKKFSSTCLPPGAAKVNFTGDPHEAAMLAISFFKDFDFSSKYQLRKEAYDKKNQTVLADSKLRGAKYPLPMTLWKTGKVREIYDLGDELLINSTNNISAFDVVSQTEIEDKGYSLNQLSAWWFKQTEHITPNHFISTPDVTMMRVKKAERINIEWVVRDYLYGSMFREYQKGTREFWGVKLPDGMQMAEKLPQTMLTPTTKAEVGHDMPITKKEAIDLKLVTPEEWEIAEEDVLMLYQFYKDLAKSRGIIIPDFKIELGRYDGNIIQIDEGPDHDSARSWVEKHYKVGKRQEAWCLDKEFYRQFLIDSGIDSKNPSNPLPEIPPIVVEEIRKRLLGSLDVFIGRKTLDDLNLNSLEEVESELLEL